MRRDRHLRSRPAVFGFEAQVRKTPEKMSFSKGVASLSSDIIGFFNKDYKETGDILQEKIVLERRHQKDKMFWKHKDMVKVHKKEGVK